MILTVEITQSQTENGGTVYTAVLRELPGVVTEGDSEASVIAELMAVVRNLHERLGTAVIGLATSSVESWSWRLASSRSESREYVYGTGEQEAAERGEEKPGAVPV